MKTLVLKYDYGYDVFAFEDLLTCYNSDFAYEGVEVD